MKSDRFRALLKQLSVLTNFWPAVLVVLAVGLALPRTIPVLKTLPERLVLTEVKAAEEKPALPDPEEETEEKLEDSGNTYKDGVYTGSSSGYGGKVTVQVTVKEHKITDVSVLSAPGETAEFLAKAKGVISRVLQAQTWEVDVVSGATYSSRGILGAIRNALTGETVENEAPPEKEGPVAPIKKVPFDDNVKWKDGVYIGSAQGYGGTIKVEVTIRQAKIAAIRVLDHSHESDSYFNKAKKVINRIIKAGTPNVDTISGATYSSNGIINAVKNALKKAAGDSSADTENPAQKITGCRRFKPHGVGHAPPHIRSTSSFRPPALAPPAFAASTCPAATTVRTSSPDRGCARIRSARRKPPRPHRPGPLRAPSRRANRRWRAP